MQDQELTYFAKPEECPSKPKGCVDLKNCYVVTKSATKRPLCFQLCSIQGKEERACDACFQARQQTELTKDQDDGSEAWQPDADVQSCIRCAKPFTVMFRRHHCRQCGGVVCEKCSKHKMVMYITRTFYLEPYTQEEKDLWVARIKLASAASGDPTMEILRSGFLQVLQGGNEETVNKWQKVFVVIRPNKFSYYSQVRFHFPPEIPKGTIDLVGAVLRTDVKLKGTDGALGTVGFELEDNSGRIWAFQLLGIKPMEGEETEKDGEEDKNHQSDADVSPPLSPRLSPRTGFNSPKKSGSSKDLEGHGSLSRTLSHKIKSQAQKIAKVHTIDQDISEHHSEEFMVEDWIGTIVSAMPKKIFNVPLITAAERSDPEGMIPSVLRIAIEWLNTYGLQENGLYRIPGSKGRVDELIAMFDKGQEVVIPQQESPGTLASLVVQFIRRMPENLFTNEYASTFEEVAGDDEISENQKVLVMRQLLADIPPCNFHTLALLINHLLQVSYYEEDNQMTPSKLAMCVYSAMARSVQFLVEHYEPVFL